MHPSEGSAAPAAKFPVAPPLLQQQDFCPEFVNLPLRVDGGETPDDHLISQHFLARNPVGYPDEKMEMVGENCVSHDLHSCHLRMGKYQ
jgi:hypothetical protein